MRSLSSSISPTPEQLKVIGDTKPGFRIIRGAAGTGKTTTSLLRLNEEIRVRLLRHRRSGAHGRVRALVLTFNRTLKGYIEDLVRKSAPTDSPALDLRILTFASWAKALAGQESTSDEYSRQLLRPHLSELTSPTRTESFLFDEIEYIRGRFEPQRLTGYLEARREGRGRAPRVDRHLRSGLLQAIAAYERSKLERDVIDWEDLAVLARDARPELLDVVIVDEAHDFSANRVRAVLRHLHPEHSTTFIADTTQRIYPRYLKWSEVGISARRIDTLTENYRNTAQIANFALPLVADLPAEDDGRLPDFIACNRHGPKPVVAVGGYRRQLGFMLDRIQSSADLMEEAVAVLQPRGGSWFNEARSQLLARRIRYCELTRRSEWPDGSESVALCTIHSAKGLEFDHVLLPGLNQEVTPHGSEPGDTDFDRLRRMLAMAIGRARKSVTVGYKPGEQSSLIDLLDPSTYDLVLV